MSTNSTSSTTLFAMTSPRQICRLEDTGVGSAQLPGGKQWAARRPTLGTIVKHPSGALKTGSNSCQGTHGRPLSAQAEEGLPSHQCCFPPGRAAVPLGEGADTAGHIGCRFSVMVLLALEWDDSSSCKTARASQGLSFPVWGPPSASDTTSCSHCNNQMPLRSKTAPRPSTG